MDDEICPECGAIMEEIESGLICPFCGFQYICCLMKKVFKIGYETTTWVAVVAETKEEALREFEAGRYVEVETNQHTPTSAYHDSHDSVEEVEKKIGQAEHGVY